MCLLLLLLLGRSVMSDSMQPHRRQPTRLLCPWDSPGKNTGVGCHFLLQCMKVKSESEVTPMDYSLPGSSIHGIFQARVLEWLAISFSNFCLSHGFLSLNFCGYYFILFILFIILLSILSQKFENDTYFLFLSVDFWPFDLQWVLGNLSTINNYFMQKHFWGKKGTLFKLKTIQVPSMYQELSEMFHRLYHIIIFIFITTIQLYRNLLLKKLCDLPKVTQLVN